MILIFNLSNAKTPSHKPEVILLFGAGEEIRTLDIHLGKVALYQLSYSRIVLSFNCCPAFTSVLHVSRLYYFHHCLSRAFVLLSCLKSLR
jgi:hypothetical protein